MHSSNYNTCTSNHTPSSIPFPFPPDYDMCITNPNFNFNYPQIDQDLQFINTFFPNSPEFEFLHLFYPNSTNHHHEISINLTTPLPNMPLEINHSADHGINSNYGNGNGNGNDDDTCSGKKKTKKKTIKTSKKDRHSKIHTINGPRDRRMRLSLSVASKFFKLQDRLGFDKASYTVDWLLTNSAAAIHDLSGAGDGDRWWRRRRGWVVQLRRCRRNDESALGEEEREKAEGSSREGIEEKGEREGEDENESKKTAGVRK